MPSILTSVLHRVRHPVQTLRNALSVVLIALGRAGDQRFGPRFVSTLLLPLLVVDALRRMTDYAYFKKLRATLPATFWPKGPLHHYLHMIRVWHETLALALLYDRLTTPRWASRLTYSGTPPHALPEWGKRPVIVTFLHTGGFGLLRYWLRAQGLTAATMLGALPKILAYQGKKIRQDGDAKYAMGDLPHIFALDGHPLRHAVRFLRPGHILILALDGARTSENLIPCEADGQVLHLKDGAIRLAQLSNAILLPVSVHRRGSCRFEFHFGMPVPEQLLQKEDRHEALQHLAQQLWNDAKNHPIDITWCTLEALAPEKFGSRKPWP